MTATRSTASAGWQPDSMHLLALLLCAAAANAQPLPSIVETLDESVDTGRAMKVMREVYARDRWFTFPRFRETAEYLAGEMRGLGLSGVEVVLPPADGKTQYGYWTMPLAWDARQARLEVVSPAVPAEQRVLADFEAIPASLGMWSGPTPPEGIEAEIVYLPKAREKSVTAEEIGGKFVMTESNPAGLKWLLVKHRAAGAVNTFTENPELMDGRQWVNAWGDKGWGMVEGDTPMPVFSISPRQTALLKDLLARGPVRVRAKVDARLYKGDYPYVTAVVPGQTPEEVLTLGHMAEQGAHDNATGVAAMVEALATIRRLVSEGKLPQPRRTIRMLAMGELYGTMHYLAVNPERVKRTVAAMTIDTPAGSYDLPGTEYTFYLNPHVATSYVDALVLKVAEDVLSRRTPARPFHWKDFMPGTDSFLGEPMIGIPTVWPYSGSGVHSHHNSADTPDTVDPRSLRDLTVITAAYLYVIANAGPEDARWLAELTATWAEEAVAAHSGERAQHERERWRRAIRSVLRLGGAEKDIAPALARIPEPEPVERRDDPELARIVVKRKRLGSIPLDDLPRELWLDQPSGAWGKVPQLALFWCDGRRNLAEVARLVRLEAGPVQMDFAGYFRLLEKHGYVEFVSSRP
ncbi:MAG: DUF4910 domain-containing protein [Bryobacterales bacterium]|nr:DUF4910 domain-containing protein [Bryobacterales bacterium]